MSFRGVQRWRPNYQAMMVKGGAVDGLADLAKAFVEAPIMRRKIELANKRLAAQEADRAESMTMRREEHGAAMEDHKAALDLKRQQLGAKSTLKPNQINGITMGIMAHARQAGTMKVGDGIETFDEEAARKEYEHLRKLVPADIRDQIPDYDGGAVGATEAPAAQHDALDDAGDDPAAGFDDVADGSGIGDAVATTRATAAPARLATARAGIGGGGMPNMGQKPGEYDGGGDIGALDDMTDEDFAPIAAQRQEAAAEENHHASAIAELYATGNIDGARQWIGKMAGEHGPEFADRVKHRVRALVAEKRAASNQPADALTDDELTDAR